jgi:hypothetical protein
VELPVRLSPAAATSSVMLCMHRERERERERERARVRESERDLGCQCLSSLSSAALYQLHRQYVYSGDSKASNIVGALALLRSPVPATSSVSAFQVTK